MKILFADDEATERAILRDILRTRYKFTPIECSDGREALDWLCDGLRPDLCLVDVRMPHLDGLEMIARIRRDPLLRHFKVVATSSSRDRNTVLALANLGISGYLLKPYVAERVFSVLDPLLGTLIQSKVTDRAPPTINLLKKTLLVVDDDPAIRTAIAAVTQLAPNWEVLEAQDGEDGLLRLKHDGALPSLILCDLTMPKMDGIAFVRRVREDAQLQKIPVVIISSDHSTASIRQLAELHISGFLVKPFDPSKVLEMMNSAVRL